MAAGLFVVGNSAWHEVGPDFRSLYFLGLNVVTDVTNRLVATARFLTHDGADHKWKINKVAAGHKAAPLFQSEWNGRAELGIAESDQLASTLFAMGSAWVTALVVAAHKGNEGFGANRSSLKLIFTCAHGSIGSRMTRGAAN